MKVKTYAVLGLGIFGSTIAKELAENNFEVIAMDKDIRCVDRVSDHVTQAVCGDFTDIEQLRAVGIQDCDVVVVATGSHLEESVMAVLNLKELNVPLVLAKAKNKKYQQVLLKVGADRVVCPEKEMGARTAKMIMSDNLLDVYALDDRYSISEFKAPTVWVSKCLKDLDLRHKFGINVIGVRNHTKGESMISPNAYYCIEEEDILIVIAENTLFANIGKLFEE